MNSKPSILVVDSDYSFAETVRNGLETSFEVTSASGLKEGLEKAKWERPELIVLGYLEPRGASFELHNKLREGQLTRNIPLVVVDVRPEEHSRKGWRRDEGLRMDAEDYICQPVEPAGLKETVERILRNRQAKPPELAEIIEQMEKILNRMDKIEKCLVK